MSNVNMATATPTNIPLDFSTLPPTPTTAVATTAASQAHRAVLKAASTATTTTTAVGSSGLLAGLGAAAYGYVTKDLGLAITGAAGAVSAAALWVAGHIRTLEALEGHAETVIQGDVQAAGQEIVRLAPDTATSVQRAVAQTNSSLMVLSGRLNAVEGKIATAATTVAADDPTAEAKVRAIVSTVLSEKFGAGAAVEPPHAGI